MKINVLTQNYLYILTFSVCLLISSTISWKIFEWQRAFNYENFRYITRENFFAIKKSIEWHEEGLIGISNYFLSSENISDDEFKSYTEYSVDLDNGFHSLGWIVPGQDETRPYRITHINIEDGYEHNPLLQIETTPAFINAIKNAQLTRRTSYSIEKSIISQDEDTHILTVHPTYLRGQLIGYAFSVIDTARMIEKSTDGINPYIHLSLMALSHGHDPQSIFETQSEAIQSSFYKRKKSITLNGLDFEFTFLPTDAFLQEYNFTKTYALFIGMYLVLCTLAILYFRQMNSHIIRIRESQLKAEESNRLKNDFLATMSHEIRSPMSGVLGMAELLLSTNLSAEQKGYTQTILSSGEVLLNIIEDILDVSKIEANKLKIEPIAVNMVDLVDDVCALYSCKAQEKAIELAVHYIPGSEQFVYADPVRVRQVLGNLINNAIKFTDKGHIVVKVWEDKSGPAEPDTTRLTFSVEDTGIGIQRSAIERIFEQFSQADSSTTRNYGGTGLGLTICKKLVGLMGGEITVSSELGRGSAFTFILPLKRNAIETTTYCRPPILKGVRTLIVDDFSTIGTILSENLELVGMECTWESDPQKAISLLTKAQAEGRSYDIAIIDFLMPGLNGEVLARKIKHIPALRDTCLIMLTAAGNPSTENIMVRECFSAYLAKPIRINSFIEKLAVIWGMYKNGYRDTLIKTDSFSMNAEKPQLFMPLTGTKVLLAEDSRINQAFAMDVLEQLSCTVKIVVNGEDAIKAVQEEKFDLVLMDCQMPVMDGFEATRHIQALKQNGTVRADLPIIALTANAMEGDRERCIDAGMSDYLSKPVRARELREKVYHWLGMGNAMYITPGLSAAGEQDSLYKGAHNNPDMIIDPDSVQTAQNILKERYGEMIGFFLQDTQNYIDEIQNAIRQGHFADGIRPAHTIKSTSERMGAVKLSNCAKELEALLKKHENDNMSAINREGVVSHLTHLCLIFDQTKPLLRTEQS